VDESTHQLVSLLLASCKFAGLEPPGWNVLAGRFLIDKGDNYWYDNDNGNDNTQTFNLQTWKFSRIPMLHQQRITIKDVAKTAGVSTQTVSRVVNERPDVADATRKRVLQVIEALGYRPSELARSLIQQRSYMLGVVTAGLKYVGGPGRALSGITGQAEELGYALLLKELPGFNANNIYPLIESLLARQVDGILWAVPEVGDNRCWVEEIAPKISVPIAFLSMDTIPGLSVIAFDNYVGGKKATQHLLEIGRRHIGHISGPLDWWEARQRRLGWEDAMREANLPITETQSAEGNWSSASGEAAFRLLLEQFPTLDSVFVANDQMALSVLQVASRRGLRVPQDLAVVGFDDLSESAYFWPPLTTIHQDQRELGAQGILSLVNRIEALNDGIVPPDPLSVTLVPELIVRESTV
jgi:DNA-binding LacI/PurR family transcriptional regulator